MRFDNEQTAARVYRCTNRSDDIRVRGVQRDLQASVGEFWVLNRVVRGGREASECGDDKAG